ncbi:MAG: methionine--tRNA ligase [Alphaproteobacteria bacterium]|nr:methionine--tRNA ligase [Alphaproteobacteria bacterium]
MKKRYLITSALPYINGIKHLGTLVGSMLPADVYARFLRQKGEEVLYICATDEHGTPAELAANEEGVSVQEYCDKYHDIQKNIYERFHLSFDHFGRTSSPQNKKYTQHFCEALSKNGLIEKRTLKQIYCHTDERFLPDRYIIGTCPHCGYDKARGDQCDKCTHLLDPVDLINPRSAVSGATDLELKETTHLYLKLPLLEKEITEWIDKKEAEGLWPSMVIAIARKWIKDGLKERCITRDLKWGVPVNYEGLEDKVFYVWFDAPIGYISATQEWVDKDPDHRSIDDWWKESDDVCYTQFMGKDNVAFHTISFPASILGTKEPWKKVDMLKGVNWLNYYGGKFSTSQHRGIFTDTALDEFESDYWRYWLMANIPENDDTSFSVESFAGVINKDLNDVLGNFINRVLKMTNKNFGTTIPEGGALSEEEKTLFAEIEKAFTSYTEALNVLEFRKALGFLRELWVLGNNYITRTEPWKVIKQDQERGAVILRTALNLIYFFGLISAPIIPESAKKILAIFEKEDFFWPQDISDILSSFKGGETFKMTEPLFEKIPEERIEELMEKYGSAE